MYKRCEVEGCDHPVYGNGLRGGSEDITRYCRKHYRWLKERGTLEPPVKLRGTMEDRFFAKFKPSLVSECWNWQGAKTAKGYGVISDVAPEKNVRGKSLLAHRVSYQLHTGETLCDGDMVLHSCDNPSCVNPHHLRKGTCQENIKEAYDKGRKKVPISFGEANPRSKLTLDQVRFIRAHPELAHTEIAKMFGLSPNCIRGVRIGRTWKDA